MSDNGIRVGHFKADSALINLPLGFVPDYFKLMDFHTNTNIIFYEWWQRMEGDLGTGLQEGVSITEGVTARLADAGGITAYNTGTQTPTVNEWTQARGSAAAARNASPGLPGTFIKATVGALNNTGQVTDREAIFECITDGTSGSSEPTWPSAIGESVLDGTTRWEMVNEAKFRKGYQGVVIAAALMTDGQEYFYLAVKAHDSIDHGDVVAWTDGIDQDWS